MGRKVTEDEVKEWVALHEKGYTYEHIGKQYRRNPKTVGEHVREYLLNRQLPKGEEGAGELRAEVDLLTMEKERQEALMELERAKEARMKVPERLDELETTLKAYGEDLESLRLRLNSQPDFSKWKCSKCGEPYVVVKVMCSSCSHEVYHGLWPPQKK